MMDQVFGSDVNTYTCSARFHSKLLPLTPVRDILTPPFCRDPLGAAVLEQDVWAQRRFGAGHFGATWISVYTVQHIIIIGG